MPKDRIDRGRFVELIGRLAAAWRALDPAAAADCFTADAQYLQPPDIQFFQGREQLRAYFGALEAGTYLRIDNAWFDEAAQTGCVEFTFGRDGRDEADHGTAVIELETGLIAQWREYVQRGPADHGRFVDTSDKAWTWHIGNYP